MSDAELVYMDRDGILDAGDCIAGVDNVEHAVAHLNTHIDNNAHPVGMLELAETLRERVCTAVQEAELWSPEKDDLVFALGYMDNVVDYLRKAGYR